MDKEELKPEVREYINNLEKSNESLESENQRYKAQYDHLLEEFKALLHRTYGRSTEQVEATQQELFNEDVSEDSGEIEPESTDVKPHSRKKAGRKPLSEMLPREEVIHDVPEEDKTCACGCELVRIGEETSERLQIIPEQIYVEKHIRPQYACKNCEGSGDEERPAVKIAPAVPSIIPGSIVTPGLLAFLFVNKYCDHLPFYRQEKRFERIGIHLSRQNMSNWQQKSFEKLKPLFRLFLKEIRGGPLIRMDETTVQVLGEEDRPDTAKSYMWLTLGGQIDHPVALYQYRKTRAASHITEIIGDFSGFLQTDGYGGYDSSLKGREGIIHVGCFAHARRKFFEASKASKKKGGPEEAMGQIARLYQIENELRGADLSEHDFLELRREKAKPILEKFHKWLIKKAQHTPPSLLLGKAVNYTLGQWDKLVAYLDSPFLTPDNNLAENGIRPFVLGRKNWLFAGSPKGAEASCGIYSLIETAKMNGLNPYEYLMHLFKMVPVIESDEDFDKLLPWNVGVGKN